MQKNVDKGQGLAESHGVMVKSEPEEFVFVQELPKREKSRWRKVWDELVEFHQVVQEKGNLLPVKLAADVAGISRQRIHELMEDKVIERVTLHGHPFIVESSFLEWAKSERKAGRPPKAVPLGEQVKGAFTDAKGFVDARMAVNKAIRGKRKTIDKS